MADPEWSLERSHGEAGGNPGEGYVSRVKGRRLWLSVKHCQGSNKVKTENTHWISNMEVTGDRTGVRFLKIYLLVYKEKLQIDGGTERGREEKKEGRGVER